MKFTLIYDDFSTGTRGKRFADMLATAAGEEGHSIAPWRCEVLEWDGLAGEATREAEASDYVIFSLRGDGSLSASVKHWTESWLNRVTDGATAIVALFDPARSMARHANGTRHYLRHVTRAAGVDFFGHCEIIDEARSIFPQPDCDPATSLLPASLAFAPLAA